MTITLGHISEKKDNNDIILECPLQIDDCLEYVLRVKIKDKIWSKYVVSDRCDGFLFAVLQYALRNHHDIVCTDVVSDALLFNLRTQYIPSLSKHDTSLHPVVITAKTTDAKIISKNKVATGLSCGVDCLHTIIENIDNSYFEKISYFLVFNDGAFGGDYNKTGRQFALNGIFDRQKRLSDELSIPIIQISNNLEGLMKIPYDQFVVYSMGLMVLSLSKLIGVYLYSSSGGDYSSFSLDDSSTKDVSYLDLLTLHCISHGPTYFYSAGGAKTRFEKMEYIIDNALTKKYLYSCLKYDFNCGCCPKCYRNLLTIDSMGKLDEYSTIYDINYFKKYRDKALEYLVREEKFHGYSYSYLHDVYLQYKKTEPKLIESVESSMSLNKLMVERDQYYSLSNERKMCLRAYKTIIQNGTTDIKEKIEKLGIKHVILYYYSGATDILLNISNEIGLVVDYIVENIKDKRQIPRLPLNTINYPPTDAIIVCILTDYNVHIRKLKERTTIPVYYVGEFLDLRLSL